MAINPNDPQHLVRLRDSMSWSKKMLTPFRRKYKETLEQYVGHHYGTNGTPERVPINMLRMSVDVYARQLAAKEPRVLALTFDQKAKSKARMLESATNKVLKQIDLGTTMRTIVKSAMFMMGIVKIGLSSESDSQSFGYQAGVPYVDPVLFDDWLHDMTARKPGEWDWCGNRYRVPYEYVMENPGFNKAAVQNIAQPDGQYEDLFGEPRSHHLSQGDGLAADEYRQHVELWDLYFPKEGIIMTLPAEGEGPPLRVVDWTGPQHGPYRWLMFGAVPGNVMPSPPAQMWLDTHDLLNRLFLKLGRQAERQKTLTFASGVAASNKRGERIMDAADGQVINSDDPGSVNEVSMGGIDQNNMAFSMELRNIYSYMAGNLDAIAGLSQQAETLGQEKIIKGSSSELMGDMADTVLRFAEDVTSDVSWWIYTDPVSSIPIEISIPNYDRKIPTMWRPEDRQVPVDAYDLRVEPYSMTPQSPAQRLNTSFQIIQQVVMPFAQQLQMQGIEVDVQALVQMAAKYADLPELLDIFKKGGFPLSLPGLAGGTAGANVQKPPVTQRNYTRQSVGTGGTKQARDATMIKQLMSGGKPEVNQAQNAAMARPGV